ncbi:MAG: nuclear transport factor 2 family protein [Opitutaceae bacterium]
MKINKPILLPEPIAQYIACANRFDAAGATGYFTPDAVVRDERRDHVGHTAIERWIDESSKSARPQVTATHVQARGAEVQMTGRVAGNFPGSPLDLDYEFRLQDGKIARLTIQ